MAKRRFVVTHEFRAWKPGKRDDPNFHHLALQTDFQLVADLDFPGDYVVFDLDAREYETERNTFVQSVKPWDPA